MTPWSIALGNVGRGSAPALAPTPRRNRPAEPTCPHCGKSLGKPGARKLWTVEEDGKLIAMLEAGAFNQNIAAALGRPPTSISSRIRTLGLNNKTTETKP
jgi:hypothetical protein